MEMNKAITITPKTTMTEMVELLESYEETEVYDDYPEYELDNDWTVEYESD